MLRALQVSFTDWDLLTPEKYIGFDNYIDLATSRDFPKALWATLQYTLLASPTAWLLGFIMAVLLNAPFKGRNLFRTAFYLPVVMPIIGISVAALVLFAPGGFISNISGVDYSLLTRKATAMPSIAGTMVWRASGYYMLLFLVGLQGIPKEYYDAAKIDGANAWQEMIHITIPLLRPVIAYVVIIGTIWGLGVIIPMFIMTEGGPANSTRSVVMLIYQSAMIQWKMGRASAMAIIIFIITVILSLIQLRFFGVGQEGK
jgi:ABC-type sugar transport system permease subunit